jgi:hypothetical protein
MANSSSAHASHPSNQDGNAALHVAAPRAFEPTVVATKVVSPKGARITEQVIVLSERAAARLEIKGRVPAR